MKMKQKGFTLIELLVGLSITGMLSCGAMGLIYNELHGTAAVKTCVSSANELTNADRCISRDVMMAESTNIVDGGKAENSLSLFWIDRYEFSNIPHTCIYSLESGNLIREYDGNVTVIARNITHLEFYQSGNVLEVAISCTPVAWETRTVDRTFSVNFRTMSEAILQ